MPCVGKNSRTDYIGTDMQSHTLDQLDEEIKIIYIQHKKRYVATCVTVVYNIAQNNIA